MSTLTGALAIIKVKGQAIGKMKGVRVNENITRGEVRGIGHLIPEELPTLSWAGTITCDAYTVEFKDSLIPEAIWRNVQSLTQFVESLILQEDGVTVDIYKKVPLPGQPTIGLIQGEDKPFASIGGMFINAEGLDVNEGQLSGRIQSFAYLKPITYPS